MLDGDLYFKAFPDEKPEARRKFTSPELLAALSALQREFQQFLATEESAAPTIPARGGEPARWQAAPPPSRSL